jgi:hypothetical protein
MKTKYSQAGSEASLDGLAGVGESRTGRGVVLAGELEGHNVSNGRLEGGWLKDVLATSSNIYFDRRSQGERDTSAQGKEEGVEKH